MLNQSRPSREIYLAIDTSTSVAPKLELIHHYLLASLEEVRKEHSFSLAVYLFNQKITPFPHREACQPKPFEQADIPCLEELVAHVGEGSALLDTLALLLDDAGRSDAPDRRIVILTDGWESGSRLTNVPQVRQKIRAANGVDVCVTGFTDLMTGSMLRKLMKALGLHHEAWALAVQNQTSMLTSLSAASRELVKFALLPCFHSNQAAAEGW